MNPTTLQTLQLMASISSSPNIPEGIKSEAHQVMEMLLRLVKKQATELSANAHGITL